MAKERIKSLDSLRGLAALLVLWIHSTHFLATVSEHLDREHPLNRFAELLGFGRLGVALFFILSGYLIAAGSNRKGWIRFFPIKRAFRLYPAFFVSIILVYVFNYSSFQMGTFLANLTMVPTLLAHPEMIPLYWTLETEMIFYVLFYLLFRFELVQSRRFLWQVSAVLTALFAIAQLALPDSALDATPLLIERLPQHLGLMFFGAYIAHCSSKELFHNKALLALAAINAAPSAYVLFEYLLSGQARFPSTSVAYLTAMGLFLSSVRFQPTHFIFEHIGRISYSLYLLHPFVIQESYGAFGDLPPLACLAIFLVGALAVAEISFRIVEKPMIQLSRKLVKEEGRALAR